MTELGTTQERQEQELDFESFDHTDARRPGYDKGSDVVQARQVMTGNPLDEHRGISGLTLASRPS